MKKTILLLFVSTLLILPIFTNKVKAQVKVLSAPEFKADRYFAIKGKGFDPKDCLVSPERFTGKIFAYSNDSGINEEGSHALHFVIFDENGKMSFKDAELVVMSSKDVENADKYIGYKGNNAQEANAALADLKGDGTKTKAYELAQNFIGMSGTCLSVAKAFIKEYLGEKYTNLQENYKDISVYEAMPGDVIYYKDGGVGIEHWAVYLGGDLALQGNYIGGTVIGKVYLNNASDPQFRRLY